MKDIVKGIITVLSYLGTIAFVVAKWMSWINASWWWIMLFPVLYCIYTDTPIISINGSSK